MSRYLLPFSTLVSLALISPPTFAGSLGIPDTHLLILPDSPGQTGMLERVGGDRIPLTAAVRVIVSGPAKRRPNLWLRAVASITDESGAWAGDISPSETHWVRYEPTAEGQRLPLRWDLSELDPSTHPLSAMYRLQVKVDLAAGPRAEQVWPIASATTDLTGEVAVAELNETVPPEGDVSIHIEDPFSAADGFAVDIPAGALRRQGEPMLSVRAAEHIPRGQGWRQDHTTDS